MFYCRIVTALILFSAFHSLTAIAQEIILLKGHAHNDYTHKRPLYDALEEGFFSIEVDVFYENGSFIVAHTSAGIRKKNTLEKLYLQPLKKRVRENNGRVYSNGPPEFELMIDLKGNWDAPQLDSLHRLIGSYDDLFTVFLGREKTSRAVRIILSGGGAKYFAVNNNPRFFSIDGNLDDISSRLDSNIICRASANFKSVFAWRGFRKMNEQEKKLLHEFVLQAHASGRKIRFWAAPNKKKVWKELLDAGVDWINVNKLKKFEQFYLGYSK